MPQNYHNCSMDLSNETIEKSKVRAVRTKGQAHNEGYHRACQHIKCYNLKQKKEMSSLPKLFQKQHGGTGKEGASAAVLKYPQAASGSTLFTRAVCVHVFHSSKLSEKSERTRPNSPATIRFNTTISVTFRLNARHYKH